MSIGSIIERAIAEYQPAWLPERGELTGWVIAIDPIGGGASDADQRYPDDLALLTGGDLYHLIQRAGAVPVMTRAEDFPALGSGAVGGPERVRSFCERLKADLAVSIEFAAAGDVGVSAGGGGELSSLLARHIAEGFEAGAVSECRAGGDMVEIGVPWAQARLGAPDCEMMERDRGVFYRACAEKLYKGIVAFAEAEGGALDAARAERFSDGDRGSVHAVPFLPDQTWDEKLKRAARAIWPDGDLPIEQAAWFLRMYRQAALSDRLVVYFEPRVTVEAGTVVIGGATNLGILRDTPAEALRAVGVVAVRNEMRLLPEEGRLDGEWFGVCVAPTALMYGEPSEAASMRTQLLYGESLWLLDREKGFYLVHGGDGYWGWVREDAVRLMSRDDFNRFSAAPRAVLGRDLVLTDRRVVRGAALAVDSVDGQEVALRLPDGGTVVVNAGDARIDDDRRVVDERVSKALALVHQTYVYGAVSPLGLDCSGLVRNIFSQTGVSMARNAAQQFMYGRLVATRWHRENIRPGDLLYFINPAGKVFHVGIAITPTHFVHSAPPEVRINSLEPSDRLYSKYRARSFFAARRLP